MFKVEFQSTLPRESDRNKVCERRLVALISIHAPSRERQFAFRWTDVSS